MSKRIILFPLITTKYEGHFFTYPNPFHLQNEKNMEDNITSLFIEKNAEKQYKHNDSLVHNHSGTIVNSKVSKKYFFHHERDRVTGSSKKGKIFHYEAIEPDYIFIGFINGKDEHIKSFIKWINEERILYIGRSKNSQYGEVRFSLIQKNEDSNLNVSDKWKGNSDENNNDILVIELLSDLILYNENGFPTTDITYLNDYFQIDNVFLKQDSIDGFKSVWKLRRNTDFCFKAGSSFQLDLKSPLNTEQIKTLLQIQEEGFGERRNEGFGQIRISIYNKNKNSFSVADNETEEYQNLKLIRKEGEISEEFKRIVYSIYKNELLNRSKMEALKIAEEIKKHRITDKASLFSRLRLMLKEDGAIDLNKLKTPAGQILEYCRLSSQNLLTYIELLENQPLQFNNLFIKLKNQPVKEMEKDFPFLLNDQENLKRLIKREHLLWLFLYLQKIIKNKGKQE